MRYLGGKYRHRKVIAQFIERFRTTNQLYIEPFVGSLAVYQEMKGPKIGSDVNNDLIQMYLALQQGWLPPKTLSKHTYYTAKKCKDNLSPQLRAFISIGCSYGGKLWGGFAQGDNRDFCNEAYRGLLKITQLVKGSTLLAADYATYNTTNCIYYCDPPYMHTTGYKIDFDNSRFWETMRKWAKNNVVIISEYIAPEDFICVKKMSHFTSMSKKSEKREEKLFRHKNNLKGEW